MRKNENNQEVNVDLVSVIIPVYNAEKFLSKAIESVINQSHKKIELILINDGSSDSSEVICNKCALADNRIKVISQKNSGPAAARNTGIRHSTGNFIFFLDADDFIEINALEILVSKYNQYQPDLVMANFSKLVNYREVINQRISFSPDNEPFTNDAKVLSQSDIVEYVRHFLRHPSNHLISYCWGRLYKSSIIKNNGITSNEAMRLFEDFVFNLEYLKHTKKIVFVNEPFYTYVMHDSHVSASMSIVNAESLLHDMGVFREKASAFLQRQAEGHLNLFDAEQEIGHALTHYVIIFLIRSCRLVAVHNRKKIYDEINKLINTTILQESLRHYLPSKGNTRILPLLMKLKVINLIIFVCKRKAYKRYGKPEAI